MLEYGFEFANSFLKSIFAINVIFVFQFWNLGKEGSHDLGVLTQLLYILSPYSSVVSLNSLNREGRGSWLFHFIGLNSNATYTPKF